MLTAAAREFTLAVLSDIESGCLCEVERAARVFDDEARGLRVRQQYFIYPNDKIVALNYCDGGYEAIGMYDEDDIATFRHYYKEFFA